MLCRHTGRNLRQPWQHEKRGTRAEFNHLFGEDIDAIDTVAIMTDTDISGRTASAAYGGPWFS